MRTFLLIVSVLVVGSTVAGWRIYGHSYSPTRLEVSDFKQLALDEAARKIVETSHSDGAPAAILYISTGTETQTLTSAAAAAGAAGDGGTAPIDVKETPLRIASISKLFTAAIVISLVQEGEIELGAKISEYLAPTVIDGLPNGDVATVRQLLLHTGGIPDYYDLGSYLFQDWKEPITLERMLPVAKRGKAAFAAGEDYSYSNMGYVLLGEIAENVTGETLGTLMENRIFDPLDLKSARYNVKHAEGARLHGRGTYARPWADTYVFWEHSGPDAGVTITAQDLGVFIRALFAKDGDFSAIGETMTEDAVEYGSSIGRGLGPGIRTTKSGTRLVGHTGDVPGYLSFAFLRESDGVVVIGHLTCDCEELLGTMVGNSLRAADAVRGEG